MEVNKVNKRILELCGQKGWTLYRLAKNADIPKSSLCAIIKHDHVPTLATIEKVCTAFDINLSQFFGCDMFSNGKTAPLYDKLWESLAPESKKLVLVYMCGLLDMEIPKGMIENEL